MFRLPAGARAASTSKEFSLRTPLKVSFSISSRFLLYSYRLSIGYIHLHHTYYANISVTSIFILRNMLTFHISPLLPSPPHPSLT